MIPDSDIVSHVTKNRNFSEYVREIRRASNIDIRDIIINAALKNGAANFFDLGCGYGYASLDFYVVLEERCLQKRINPNILDKVNYYGFDLYVKPIKNEDKRVNLVFPKDITGSFEDFPEIALGVAFFSLPYLDDKLSALNSWHTSLNKNGKIIATHYYTHQIKIHDSHTGEKCDLDLTKCFPATLNYGNDPLLMLERASSSPSLPIFLYSEMENTQWYKGIPKGPHPGQKISHYLVN
ncbi:MAG: hypothetical protein AABW92_02245 [Nanoarchaeota archaeon]